MFACERPRNKGLCGFVRILIWFLLRALWYCPEWEACQICGQMALPLAPDSHVVLGGGSEVGSAFLPWLLRCLFSCSPWWLKNSTKNKTLPRTQEPNHRLRAS